jgi:hypothetical protein
MPQPQLVQLFPKTKFQQMKDSLVIYSSISLRSHLSPKMHPFQSSPCLVQPRLQTSSPFYPFFPRSRYHSHLKISIFNTTQPPNQYLIKQIASQFGWKGPCAFSQHVLSLGALARAGPVHPSAYPYLPTNLNQPSQTPPRSLACSVPSRSNSGHTHTFFPIKAKTDSSLAKVTEAF